MLSQLVQRNVSPASTGVISSLFRQLHLWPGSKQPILVHAKKNLAEGLDALGRGDTVLARTKFREAWKHESDLTLAERNQLKDKLTLLQPKRITSSDEHTARRDECDSAG